jgi:hypothetical protein
VGTTSIEYVECMNQAHIAHAQRRTRQLNPVHPVDKAPGHINGTRLAPENPAAKAEITMIAFAGHAYVNLIHARSHSERFIRQTGGWREWQRCARRCDTGVHRRFVTLCCGHSCSVHSGRRVEKKHGSAERTVRPNHNTGLGRARIPFGCSGKQGRKGHFSVYLYNVVW